jgi:hypothetical protein
MRTLIAILADRADEIDGKSTIVGVFQAVTARRFPTTLNGVLVLRFSLDDPEDDAIEGLILETRFLGPDREQLGRLEIAADAPPRTALMPLRGIDVTVDLTGTLLPAPGVYRFEVWARDELRAVVPVAAWQSD